MITYRGLLAYKAIWQVCGEMPEGWKHDVREYLDIKMAWFVIHRAEHNVGIIKDSLRIAMNFGIEAEDYEKIFNRIGEV